MTNRNDYDDRRRRPPTGPGPEYQSGPGHEENRFATNRALRMKTLSLEEAVDRHRSRSPRGAAFGPGHAPQPRPHIHYPPAPTAARFDGAPPERHYSRGERRSGADFVVPQDMAASFEEYERPMDPRAFREECRKAYMEAAAARQRNAEMSVWGRCSWATYDKFDPRNRNRRH